MGLDRQLQELEFRFREQLDVITGRLDGVDVRLDMMLWEIDKIGRHAEPGEPSAATKARSSRPTKTARPRNRRR